MAKNLTIDFLHNYIQKEVRTSDPIAYQYDLGRVLVMLIPDVTGSVEVHYWKNGMQQSEAYTATVEAADKGSMITAHVPNKYFETSGDLRVYVFIADSGQDATMYEGLIPIKERPKPDGYVDDDPDNTATQLIEAAGQAVTRAQAAAASAQGYAAQAAAVAASIPSDYTELDERVTALEEGGTGGGGSPFDSGYQDEEGYIHLTENGEDVEWFDPFQISGGGGGDESGSKLVFAIYSATTFSVMETAGTAPITFKFVSTDRETGAATGAGNLAISVGGVIKANQTIAQGDNLSVDVFQYLATGANQLKLIMTDSYGKSATRSFTITKETFSLEWSLGETVKNAESSLSFYITPTGTGTKTIYTYVDGSLYTTDVVTTSGRRLTKSVTGLTHGAHTVEVYGTMVVGGSTLESNRLVAAVAQIGSSSAPVIAVKWPTGTLTQYTTETIKYMVVDPSNNPAEVSLLIGGVVQTTLSADQSQQAWAYRPTAAGTFTLGIMCGGTMVTKSVTVQSIGADVDEVTDSLAIKIDPAVITDLQNWSYAGYRFTFSDNFDFTNGGLQTDANGVHCIRITAGDRLKLNYPLFGDDARRNGKECKIVYKVANSSSKSAKAISCVADGVGLQVNANNVVLSGNQTSITLSTCEDEKTELDMNIEQSTEDSLMYLYEKMSTFSIDQYAAGESFTHGTAADITFGCDEADVYLYLFRAYSRDLTVDELMANYVFDGADGAEILDRQNRNDIYDSAGNIDLSAAETKNPDTHFLIINAARMTLGKKDEVTGTLQHVYANGGSSHNWTADMTMKVQGTSSVEHAATAGPNINFELGTITCTDGTVLTDGYAMNGAENSIPTKLITFKKNIASEDHIVNRAVAEWYNRFQPSVRAARVADPRVRDCLESTMAAVFFHNTGSTSVQVGPDTVQPDETIFFGLGNLCSNKDAAEVFEYDDIVIEVKNNTEDQVRFKSKDLTGDNFSNNYEFRYLNEDAYTEAEAIAAWQQVQSFIYDTDWTAATNTALSPVVTINGQTFAVDSAAYRKAKWKAEAPALFDMDTLYFHHNITLFFLLRDNRAKNMFWSRNSQGKWGLWFNWDNDTGLCRNNRGYIDIEPGYMDFDTIGTADVFNGADNALFTNLRECNADQLRQNYLNMESAGAWNIDNFYAYIKESQEQLCESLWLEDAQHNAIRTLQNLSTADYLERATGRLRLHLKKALIFQKVMVDSYYNSTAATADSANLRGYTPATWTGVQPSSVLTVIPYTDMYINILAGSVPYQQRAYAGMPVQIDLSSNFNDTEIYLRHAPWIQELGDMSGMYLGQFEASRLTRIRKLLIGSDVEGYYNTNFVTASFANCLKLEELNLGGLTNAARGFDFSSNLYLEKIYTKGSGVTGLTFAKNGRLKEAYLNAVSSLYMNGLRLLETFEMESYANLTSITVEDSPAVDSYAIAAAAANLAHVRLTDIAWAVATAAYDVLVRLHGIQGIDDEGYDTNNGVITGAVYFRAISQTKYNAIVALIPDVSFTYGELLEEVNVTFKNDDGTVLYTTRTERGGSVLDPITAGIIQTPTKTPTIEKTFTYWKWDTSLDYIAEDTVITATYTEADRSYIVRFLDYDDTVLETYTVPAYGSASYSGEDPERSGYIWTGWDTDTSRITADTDAKAVYAYPTMPSVNHYDDMSDFDYAYSDDPNDTSAYTFGELYSIIKTGRAESYLPLTCKVKLVWDTDAITDEYSIFNLHSYGHYELADGTGMSHADFFMTHVLIANRQMNTSNVNTGGWDSSALRTWLNGTLYRAMPSHWRALIAQSITLANAGARTSTINRSTDYLRLMSHAEVGFDTSAVPYTNEIDSNASEKTFPQYTSNNSRIKKNYYGTGTAQNVWLRSADSGSASNFRFIGTNGLAGSNAATSSYGVCAGFSA